MQNLGYFQLQVNSPGLYGLALARGRESTLFTIDGATYLRSESSTGSTENTSNFEENSDGTGVTLNTGGITKGAESRGKLLAIRSFVTEDSYTARPRGYSSKRNIVHVTKRPGMEHMSLLDKDQNKSGEDGVSLSNPTPAPTWETVFGTSRPKSVVSKKEGGNLDTIHVFSLATGHMYVYIDEY